MLLYMLDFVELCQYSELCYRAMLAFCLYEKIPETITVE